MDYVFLIAGSIMIITCFYFIVSPFFTKNEDQAAGVCISDETMSLDQVYGAVNEFEMDFLMKKITREDFEKLKEQYQLLAAELLKKDTKVLKAEKSKKHSDGAEDEILRELRKLREQKG
jgi:flagellar biosynthesis protein FliP